MPASLITHAAGISFYLTDEVPTFNAVQGSIAVYRDAVTDTVCVYQNADGGTVWRLFFPGESSVLASAGGYVVPSLFFRVITGDGNFDYFDLPESPDTRPWKVADAWIIRVDAAAAATYQIIGFGGAITDAMAIPAGPPPAGTKVLATQVRQDRGMTAGNPLRVAAAGSGGGSAVVFALLYIGDLT